MYDCNSDKNNKTYKQQKDKHLNTGQLLQPVYNEHLSVRTIRLEVV